MEFGSKTYYTATSHVFTGVCDSVHRWGAWSWGVWGRSGLGGLVPGRGGGSGPGGVPG